MRTFFSMGCSEISCWERMIWHCVFWSNRRREKAGLQCSLSGSQSISLRNWVSCTGRWVYHTVGDDMFEITNHTDEVQMLFTPYFYDIWCVMKLCTLQTFSFGIFIVIQDLRNIIALFDCLELSAKQRELKFEDSHGSKQLFGRM